jgi:hypothetical protein
MKYAACLLAALLWAALWHAVAAAIEVVTRRGW